MRELSGVSRQVQTALERGHLGPADHPSRDVEHGALLVAKLVLGTALKSHATWNAIAVIAGGPEINWPAMNRLAVRACNWRPDGNLEQFTVLEAKILLSEGRALRWPTCAACLVLLDLALELRR